MKRLVICFMVLALVLSFCSCGKKTKAKSNTAGEKDNASQSIMIEEDTIDGSISLDDVEDLPELDDLDSLDGEDSNQGNSSEEIGNNTQTGTDGSGNKSNGDSSTGGNKNSGSDGDGAVEQTNDDWGPLT